MRYATFIVRRILQIIPLLVGLSILVFTLIRLAPGDPVAFFVPDGGYGLVPEMRERVVRELGLDRPLLEQYWRWASRVLQGDFGYSFVSSAPVAELIITRLPLTLQLMGASVIVAVGVAIPTGVFVALRQYSLADNLVTTGAFLGLSLPSFWFALMLMLFFSLQLRWLPALGSGSGMPLLQRLPYFVMPVLVQSSRYMASYTRFMRSSMLEVIRTDYVRTARAKGLSERVVVYRHALRNALLPMITIVGMTLPSLLGGSIIVETIFAWPGIGRLAYDSVIRRDYPAVMALTIMSAIFVMLCNLAVDIAYLLVDPRISYDEGEGVS